MKIPADVKGWVGRRMRVHFSDIWGLHFENCSREWDTSEEQKLNSRKTLRFIRRLFMWLILLLSVNCSRPPFSSNCDLAYHHNGRQLVLFSYNNWSSYFHEALWHAWFGVGISECLKRLLIRRIGFKKDAEYDRAKVLWQNMTSLAEYSTKVWHDVHLQQRICSAAIIVDQMRFKHIPARTQAGSYDSSAALTADDFCCPTFEIISLLFLFVS